MQLYRRLKNRSGHEELDIYRSNSLWIIPGSPDSLGIKGLHCGFLYDLPSEGPQHRNNELSGWVKSFYLTTRIPWEDQAKALKQENDKLKQKLASAQMENKESVGREQELNAELAQLEKSIKKSEDEYRSLKLESTDYLRLKSEHDSTLKNLDMLTRKNEKLTTSQRNIFFGMGGAVVLCGFVLGLIIGKQDKRRKSYY
jgi:SH3 domain protein